MFQNTSLLPRIQKHIYQLPKSTTHNMEKPADNNTFDSNTEMRLKFKRMTETHEYNLLGQFSTMMALFMEETIPELSSHEVGVSYVFHEEYINPSTLSSRLEYTTKNFIIAQKSFRKNMLTCGIVLFPINFPIEAEKARAKGFAYYNVHKSIVYLFIINDNKSILPVIQSKVIDDIRFDFEYVINQVYGKLNAICASVVNMDTSNATNRFVQCVHYAMKIMQIDLFCREYSPDSPDILTHFHTEIKKPIQRTKYDHLTSDLQNNTIANATAYIDCFQSEKDAIAISTNYKGDDTHNIYTGYPTAFARVLSDNKSTSIDCCTLSNLLQDVLLTFLKQYSFIPNKATICFLPFSRRQLMGTEIPAINLLQNVVAKHIETEIPEVSSEKDVYRATCKMLFNIIFFANSIGYHYLFHRTCEALSTFITDDEARETINNIWGEYDETIETEFSSTLEPFFSSLTPKKQPDVVDLVE